jgi:hypothetical protein
MKLSVSAYQKVFSIKSKLYFIFAAFLLVTFSGCMDPQTIIKTEYIEKQNSSVAPELSDLVIESLTSQSVTIKKPELKKTVADAAIQAFIGKESVISIIDDQVSQYTEGMIDVSRSGYQFKSLSITDNYRIIVIAKNISGSSVKQIVIPKASDRVPVEQEYQKYLTIDPADFLTGEGDTPDRVTASLKLPVSGIEGTSLIWKSSDLKCMGNDGSVFRFFENVSVTLTLTIVKGEAVSQPIEYQFTVYRDLFQENFEKGLTKWSYDPYFQHFSISSADPVKNNYLVLSYFSYLEQTLSSGIQPENIRFRVKHSSIYGNSTFNLYGNSLSDNLISTLYFYYQDDYYSPGINISITQPDGEKRQLGLFEKNSWLLIEYRNINWETHDFDLFINGKFVNHLFFTFKENSVQRIKLSVDTQSMGGSSCFDEIEMW